MSKEFMPLADPSLISRIEQFYYFEARLLDERKAQQWMALLTEDISYVIPSRHIPMADVKLRGTEAYHGVEQELEYTSANESPLRVENIFNLAIRIDRLYKLNAWAENPPPRTRRFVMNVEVAKDESGVGDYRIYNNFQLHYSRHGRDNHIYTGQRRDVIREVDGSFKIAAREIIFDWNVLEVPTLGLLF